MKPALKYMVFALCYFIAIVVHASEPVVENLTFSQRIDGSQLVDIFFDVSDADGDSMVIGVSVSNDNGATWQIHVSGLSGDVGHEISPGVGKSIVWDAGFDLNSAASAEYVVRIVASDAGVAHTTHSPSNYWIMDWAAVDWSDDNVVERIAKGDVAVISVFDLWDDLANEQLNVIGRLKAHNPDIVVLGYFLSKTNKLFWRDNPLGSFTRSLYESTTSFWSYTTTGDTLMNWPNQVVLNVLNPACRDSIVMPLKRFQDNTANPLDGILWDYFDNRIWISPAVAGTVEGDPDLDGNGIAMDEDGPERIVYRAACDSLVMRTREIMGENFIQVFNGTRSHKDPAFAALGDGIYYEIFPTQVFPDPDMAFALDPAYEYNLFNAHSWPRTDNGGPYIVLGMYWESFYNGENMEIVELSFGDMYRVVALLTDTYTTWIPGNHRYNWPDIEINLGAPLGPTSISGTDYSREFEFGRVDMTMKSGRYPDPFRYKITVRDRVVQEIDVPYHYP